MDVQHFTSPETSTSMLCCPEEKVNIFLCFKNTAASFLSE